MARKSLPMTDLEKFGSDTLKMIANGKQFRFKGKLMTPTKKERDRAKKLLPDNGKDPTDFMKL